MHAAGADRLDMRRPRIDQRDVVAECRKAGADLTADRTSTDEGDAFGHVRLSPLFLAPQPSPAARQRGH
jgi:predicted N-acetyltransferase YhbS